MATIADWYPPTPPNIPPDLAIPSARYRLRVFIVLVCLILFFGFYLALTAGSLYAVYKGFTMPLSRHDNQFIIRLLMTVIPGLLFLFLLKGLFKRQRNDPPFRVRIHEKEHPRLFAFIRQLCAETGAPIPYRVYLSADVNAAVFYHTSVLSLVWPTPKNLVIGLGLVNVLNLSEFKAVLAHELGHFGQKSMKVGPYVYVANRIIADIVYGRDWLDDVLGGWRRLDLRISWIAWGASGVVWVLRQVLTGFFKAVNFLHSALSRQMEFNADLVAVSVSGSDALIHALSRLGFAGEALDQAMGDLHTAADHRLYTTDLYHHHTHAAGYLRTARKDPLLGEPPPLPADPACPSRVFDPGDEGIPLMWASHPSNFDREQNAKRRYIRAELDDQSPWVLFNDAQQVRETVTRSFYEQVVEVPPDTAFTPASEVQAFINEEHAETTYNLRYHGLYDGRLLECGDIAPLVQAAANQPWDDAGLTQAHAALYADELLEWLAQHNRRLEDNQRLNGYLSGDIKMPGGGRFNFRDNTYVPHDIKGLLEKLDQELEEDRFWLAEFDRKVFCIYYPMARAVDENLARELRDRYQFHLGVQEILRPLLGQAGSVQAALQFISDKRELQQREFQEVQRVFRDGHQVLYHGLKVARDLRIPALKNLTPGMPLSDFLLEENQLIWGLDADGKSLSGEWIGKFLDQFGTVQDKTRRIHFKSLGGILALQERIADRWLARTT